jgi:hypothetical protein
VVLYSHIKYYFVFNIIFCNVFADGNNFKNCGPFPNILIIIYIIIIKTFIFWYKPRNVVMPSLKNGLIIVYKYVILVSQKHPVDRLFWLSNIN